MPYQLKYKLDSLQNRKLEYVRFGGEDGGWGGIVMHMAFELNHIHNA